MQDDQREKRMGRVMMAIGAVFIAFGVLWFASDTRGANSAGTSPDDRVAKGARQAQQLHYTRCGHDVLRRIDVPEEWIGLGKDAVAQQMDDGFRLTGFSPHLIDMSCRLDMHCPQHFVLMLDGDGHPAIFHNRYGFEMEHVADAQLAVADEGMREQLVQGIAFDSREDLERWVMAQNL